MGQTLFDFPMGFYKISLDGETVLTSGLYRKFNKLDCIEFTHVNSKGDFTKISLVPIIKDEYGVTIYYKDYALRVESIEDGSIIVNVGDSKHTIRKIGVIDLIKSPKFS